MTVSVTHALEVATADNPPAGGVGSTAWNADHVVEQSAPGVLGKLAAGAGAVGIMPPADVLAYLAAERNPADASFIGATSSAPAQLNVPAWARSFKMTLFSLSMDGSDTLLLQLGHGSPTPTRVTTGYTGSGKRDGGTNTGTTSGIVIPMFGAGEFVIGYITFVKHGTTGHTWIATGEVHSTDGHITHAAGTVTLPAACTAVYALPSASNTGDNGSIALNL